MQIFVVLVFLFLTLAILNDQYDLATLLIRYNAKVNQVGPLNRTALHESAFLGLENFVYLLLESGANPNACDSKQKTPLVLAAQNGHLNIVEILLEKGLQGFQKMTQLFILNCIMTPWMCVNVIVCVIFQEHTFGTNLNLEPFCLRQQLQETLM